MAERPAAAGRLVLASASPRRSQLLGLLGRPFDVEPSDVDETPHPGEAPDVYVGRVALDKARVAMARHPGRVVIAADTTVAVDDEILAKPVDAADAVRMLRLLSGREHLVHTGLVVGCRRPGGDALRVATVTSAVEVAVLDDADIDAYVATGEPLDKAGAYAIQGGAAPFVVAVRGSVTGIVGLPLAELRVQLRLADEWFASDPGDERP